MILGNSKFIYKRKNNIVETNILNKWIKSNVYNLNVNDVSQMNYEKKSDLLENVKSFLNNAKEETVFKLYKEGQKIILNTSFEADVDFATISDLDDDFISDCMPNTGEVAYFKDDYIKYGDKYLSFLKVDSFSKRTYSNILEMFNVDYFVCLRKKSKAYSDYYLRNKRHSSDQFANTYHRNHGAIKKYQEADHVIMQLDENAESLYYWEAWLKVEGFSREELEFNIAEFVGLSKKLGIKLFREKALLDIVFNKYLIGNFYPFSSTLELSSLIANLVPLFQEKIHEQGVRLESPTHNDLCFNLFDRNEGNPHIEITGSSGNGKTCFGAYLSFEHHRLFGVNLVIVDMLGGLRRLSNYLGGKEVSTSINPMLFGKNVEFLKNFIVSVIGAEELTRKEEGKLHGAIQEWADNDSSEEFESLLAYLEEKLGDIQCYFNEISPFLSSVFYSELPKVAYIDLAKIPDQLLDAYLVYVRAMADRMDGQSIIMWDECWQIVEKAPHFLEYAFKVDRKKSISNMILNQEKHSFFNQNEKLAKVIESSANFEVIYKQGNLNNTLSGMQLDFYKSLDYKKNKFSDALLVSKSNDICKVIRVRPYKFFYELTFTDDKKRWQEQEEFLDRRAELVGYKQAFSEWMEFTSKEEGQYV
jgi:hypothetical protein